MIVLMEKIYDAKAYLDMLSNKIGMTHIVSISHEANTGD